MTELVIVKSRTTKDLTDVFTNVLMAIHPNNLAWRIRFKGGELVDFAMPGFGSGWMKELDTLMTLPDVQRGSIGNQHFTSVTQVIRTIAENIKPCDNVEMEGDLTETVPAALVKIADELDAAFGAAALPVTGLAYWISYGELAPVELSISAEIRNCLVPQPVELKEAFEDYVSKRYVCASVKEVTDPLRVSVQGEPKHLVGRTVKQMRMAETKTGHEVISVEVIGVAKVLSVQPTTVDGKDCLFEVVLDEPLANVQVGDWLAVD